MIRDTLGMIARRSGDDPTRPLRFGHQEQAVQGTAFLEAPGDVQVFELKVERVACLSC